MGERGASSGRLGCLENLGRTLVLACLKFDREGITERAVEGPFGVGAYLLALDLQYGVSKVSWGTRFGGTNEAKVVCSGT